MFGPLKPAPAAEKLPAERVDPEYRRLRKQVFAGIFVGYAAYYLVRNTLALAVPDLLRYFKGRRAPANILFMALTLVAVVVYWLNLKGPLWVDYLALVAIGFLIYGPIMIIGLHALDLVPKKAAGTAAGFTGFFGYVFGSAIAGTGVGWIADRWGWNGVFVTMVACCLLTIAFTAMTLGHVTHSARRDG